MKKNLFLPLFILLFAASLQAQLVITEIMYNNAGGDDLEFVELYNNSATTVDLTGYTFSQGITYTFPATSVAAGDFVLVCTDSILFTNVFGVTAFQWSSGALTNTGEDIELSDAAGNVVDIVDYDDGDPWSVFADGNGPSLVLCDFDADNNDGSNWQAATTSTGLTYSNVPLLANPGAVSGCDGTSILSLSDFEASASENDGTLTFDVLIENPSSLTTTVQLEIDAVSSADLGTDFTLSTTSIEFPPNSSDVQSFDVNIIDDMEIESVEQITIKLTNPTNGAILLTDSLNIALSDNDTPLDRNMILTGIWDAQLPGMAGTKGFEVYVKGDIADLSAYGIGVANNGGGTDGLEWNFPAGSATTGDIFYIAEDSTEFHNYFGFAPNYVGGIAAINGDDSVELYENAQVIDVFGDVELDGTGEAWEYEDGWAYRRLGTGPDGNTFVLNNWDISGLDALDGAETNAAAPTPYPIGSYSIPSTTLAQNDAVNGSINTTITIDVLANDFVPGAVTSLVPILGSGTSGSLTVNGDNTISYTPPMDFCGTDMFDYEVCDAAACSAATVTISIECPASYPVYSVATVTTNNAMGINDSLGISCEISGRVYGVNIKNDGGLSFVVMDANNDGIVAFSDDLNFGYTVNEGDEVVVRGTIDQYNGLAELILDTVFTTTLGIAEVSPLSVGTLNESTESQLVLIENVYPVDPAQWDSANGTSGFNVDFTNGVDTFVIRIDNDVELYNMSIPSGSVFNISGLGGQFDFAAPYDEGYQLLPRYLADINEVTSTKNVTFDFNIALFPNPTTDYIYVESEKQLDEIQVFNNLGQQILEIQNPPLREKLNVQNLAKGIYTLTMIENGIRVSKQISIQ